MPDRDANNNHILNGHNKAGKLAEDLASMNQRATNWLINNNWDVVPHNGQRISTLKDLPPGFVELEEGNEVFMVKIPRSCFEDEILPFMLQAGRIYKMRLMMDFSGFNRGFCFLKYFTTEDASRACRLLDGQVLRKGQTPPIGVCISFDNRRLFFDNLPIKCNKEALIKCLKQHELDVVDAQMPNVAPDAEKRIAFVEFRSHEEAARARRILVPADPRMDDRKLIVEWAKVKNPPKPISAHHQQQPPQQQQQQQPKQPPQQEPLLEPTYSILGPKAMQLFDNPVQQSSCSGISICNINPLRADINQLKKIFQLGSRLQIVRINLNVHINTLFIEYANKDQADLMLEALIMMPECFKKLAQPHQLLSAFRI